MVNACLHCLSVCLSISLSPRRAGALGCLTINHELSQMLIFSRAVSVCVSEFEFEAAPFFLPVKVRKQFKPLCRTNGLFECLSVVWHNNTAVCATVAYRHTHTHTVPLIVWLWRYEPFQFGQWQIHRPTGDSRASNVDDFVYWLCDGENMLIPILLSVFRLMLVLIVYLPLTPPSSC